MRDDGTEEAMRLVIFSFGRFSIEFDFRMSLPLCAHDI